MRAIVPVLLWLLLLGLAAVRFWAAVAGLSLGLNPGAAVLGAVLLLWLGGYWRGYWLLWLAVLAGAVASWHLPWLVALPLAAPRVFLALPGVVSTALANRRHPRMRWSSGSI